MPEATAGDKAATVGQGATASGQPIPFSQGAAGRGQGGQNGQGRGRGGQNGRGRGRGGQMGRGGRGRGGQMA